MKNNQTKLYNRCAILSFIIPLGLQIAFFVHQAKNKIFSIWNIIATAMLVGIFINAIRMMINDSLKTQKDTTPDNVYDDSSTNHYGKVKQRKKSFVIKLIISAVLIGISVLFFNVYNNKSSGLKLVDSRVISQWGETKVTTEETDEGITQTEEDYIEVLVEYEFNGEQKSARITGKTTSKIYVDELKIYVNEKGEFINDHGRILAWKIESILFLAAAILLILFTIFSLGVEFIAGLIFTLAGSALFFLVGCPFIENILYNDINCFLACFINIGIYMLSFGLLNLILSKNKTSITPQIKQNQIQAEKQQFSSITNLETTCKGCGAKISSNDNFCQYCGTKKD